MPKVIQAKPRSNPPKTKQKQISKKTSKPQPKKTKKFPITFITGNKKKLEEFLSIMTGKLASHYDVSNLKLDLDELQGDAKTIALRKVKTAC